MVHTILQDKLQDKLIISMYHVNNLLLHFQRPLQPPPAGGNILSAVIGVTRTFTSFLGAAFQVSHKSHLPTLFHYSTVYNVPEVVK